MKTDDRRKLIAMALRQAKPGMGSSPEVAHEAPETYGGTFDLPDLEELRYIVVGGLATARYMPPRMTLDVDILLSIDEAQAAERLLEKAGCRRTGALAIGGSSWFLPGGRRLDLIALDQPWVNEALAAAVPDEKGVPFASLPFLVLMKLESGRLQDLADISRMLGYAPPDQVEAVRALILRYRPQDAEDLESMLVLGQLEHS